MLLGEVVGNVVATRKSDALVGYSLLVVDCVSAEDGPMKSQRIVAVDTVGAGIGERVLLVVGSGARTVVAGEAPVDAAIVGIVDEVSIQR